MASMALSFFAVGQDRPDVQDEGHRWVFVEYSERRHGEIGIHVRFESGSEKSGGGSSPSAVAPYPPPLSNPCGFDDHFFFALIRHPIINHPITNHPITNHPIPLYPKPLLPLPLTPYPYQ